MYLPMRMRQAHTISAFKAIFLSVCLGLCSIVFASMSFAGQSVKPLGAWSVSSVISSNLSSAGVCQARVTYENGDRFVFVRDVSGRMSLALTRAQDIDVHYSPAKLYTTIDGFDQHIFQARSVNQGKTFIVQLGLRYDFVDNLMAGHEFQVRYSEKGAHVSYSLKGSSDGVKALNACLRQLNNGQELAFEHRHALDFIEPALGGVPPYAASVSPIDDRTRTYIHVHKPQPRVLRESVVSVDVKSPLLNQDTTTPIAAPVEPVEQHQHVEVKAISMTDETGKTDEADEDHKTQKLHIAPVAEARFKEVLQDISVQEDIGGASHVCSLGGDQVETHPLLRRVLHGDVQPKLRLVSDHQVAIPLEANAQFPSLFWEGGSVQSFMISSHFDQTYKSRQEVQHNIIGNLRQECAGDFAYTQNDPRLYKGLTIQNTQVVCIGRTAVTGFLSFVSDGLETAVFSFEGPLHLQDDIEQQQQALLDF